MLFNVKSINAASDVAGRDVVIYMTALDGRRFDYAGRRYIDLMKQESVSHLKKGLHIIFTLYGMHWETKILLMQ